MTSRIGAGASGPHRGRSGRRPRGTRGAARAAAVAVLMMAAPAGAQTPSADEASGAAGAAVPSPASLSRIRAALEADRSPDRMAFGDPGAVWIVPPRPSVDLLPGLGFVEGLGLYDDLTRGREPVPIGGPTHWAMMNQMTPREVNEVASTDVLGIATASAFAAAAALAPLAIRKIAGWFSGSGPRPPADPVLTADQRAAVIENMRANTGVIDATLRQDGRTVALSLLVPAGTEPGAAREIGERFVRLVSRRAGANRARGAAGEDEPGAEREGGIGPGAFDYIINVRSPADAVIARGGRATHEPRVRW